MGAVSLPPARGIKFKASSDRRSKSHDVDRGICVRLGLQVFDTFLRDRRLIERQRRRIEQVVIRRKRVRYHPAQQGSGESELRSAPNKSTPRDLALKEPGD